MCPCLLLPVHFLIIGLDTLPPVTLAPTAAGIIVRFFLSLCVWPQWQGPCPGASVLLAEGLCWVLPVTLLTGSKSYVFVERVNIKQLLPSPDIDLTSVFFSKKYAH